MYAMQIISCAMAFRHSYVPLMGGNNNIIMFSIEIRTVSLHLTNFEFCIVNLIGKELIGWH
jgi:hypothetical protein